MESQTTYQGDQPGETSSGLTPTDAAALLRLADRYPEQLPADHRVAIRAALLGLVHLGQAKR